MRTDKINISFVSPRADWVDGMLGHRFLSAIMANHIKLDLGRAPVMN